MEYIVNLLPDPNLWWVICVCAVLIGFTKTSFAAVGTIVVPIMALAFGAKASTGLLLPILCLADLGAIIYYRRSCSWSHLVRLLGWAVAGLFVGIAVDHFIPSSGFRYLLAFSILISVAVLGMNQMKERRSKAGEPTESKPRGWLLGAYGVLGGFATMIGNAAGPIMSIYLLSVKMPKLYFVGTSAWFFMAINYIKMPLQIWVWDNIHYDSLLIGLAMVPFIAIGSVVGVYLVKVVPEELYRKMVIWITLFSALILLL
ncbi:MAG: sulfite exporter TauE/SafE family protein [Rikenellaceae bacterium]